MDVQLKNLFKEQFKDLGNTRILDLTGKIIN